MTKFLKILLPAAMSVRRASAPFLFFRMPVFRLNCVLTIIWRPTAIVCKKIRLDISGTDLDYLRQFMLPDTEFTNSDFWGENQKDYNVTRSDFAFDFVNYKPEFLDSVLNWIKDQERGGELSKNEFRLRVGRSSGIQYSYRCGCGQKTLYLGSPRGDKMVRIYDKLLEQTQNGVFKHGRDPRF